MSDMSGARTMALHPEHLADLRRSGLTDETISALEIHSARPGDIPRLAGWNPKEVTSVLVFPYPGEAGFCRIKVFPAFVDKNGRKVKYLQRSGTGVRLYVPPFAARHLTNPYEPLAWTEGEKKPQGPARRGLPASVSGDCGIGWKIRSPSRNWMKSLMLAGKS